VILVQKCRYADADSDRMVSARTVDSNDSVAIDSMLCLCYVISHKCLLSQLFATLLKVRFAISFCLISLVLQYCKHTLTHSIV